ncbi:MAG: MMPL family transporter [Planctomycetota bacterium]|nr:MMPL family transporter [Planctomycetota bacterium]
MTGSLASRVSRLLIDWRWALLALAAVLVAAAYLPAHRLDFDRSIENMFAPDDPLLVPYRQLQRTFGGDAVVMAAYVDPQLMTDAGLRRVQQLTERLAAVAGVQSAFSLTTTPLGTEIISNDQRGPAFLALLEDYNIGADRRTTAVTCMLDPNAPSEAREKTLTRMKEVVKQHDSQAVLVGGPVMVTEGFRLVEDDGNRLGWIATVLLMLTIIACFRSLRWVLVPIVVVNATLLLTKAALWASGLQLSMVSSMLWSIITVIGIATVVHVVVRFREARSEKHSPRDALLVAGTVLATPIMWTCFTDAAGFASLMAAEVGPVSDFGIMMAVGSLLTLVSLALILPGLVLWGSQDVDPQWAWGETALSTYLRRSMDAVLRWPKTIGLVSLVVVGLAALGCTRLQVESDFTRNFRSSSEIVRSYNFVESNLSGAGVWDVIVPAPPPDYLGQRYLRILRHLQGRLREEVTLTGPDGEATPGLTKVISIVDGLDTVPTPQYVARSLLVRVKHKRLIEEMPDVAESLYAEDPQQPGKYFARIMLRARERQSSQQKQQLIEQVTRISREVFSGKKKLPQAEVTGFFVLLTNLIDSMLRDQWVTFGVATAAIGLMVLVAFRSPVLAAVALVPNVLPILVVTGIMGWLEVKINMGAAMIAAVSMGLSIDSEIHYITMFRRLRREGHTVRDALYAVQQSVGRAVFFSTLALVVGFGALCLSDFIPTVYFGALVGLSLLGGLAGNLVVLPLLLSVVVRDAGCGTKKAEERRQKDEDIRTKTEGRMQKVEGGSRAGE